MKRTLVFLLTACLALGLAGCGKPAGQTGPGSASPRASPGAGAPAATEAPQPRPTPAPGWVVEPRSDLEIVQSLAEFLPVEHLTTAERQQLALFTQNGGTGVIDLAGNIVVPAEKNVHWCPVCGITNEGETEIYNAQGEVVGSGGHGISESGIFYDEASGTLYLEDWMGYLQPWSQEYTYSPDPIIAKVVSITALTGLEDPGSSRYHMGDEEHPVELSEPSAVMLFLPDGTPLTDTRYEAVEAASESVFPVKQGGLWGFVSAADGKEMVPCQYRQVRPFKNGLAAVQTDTGWGYVSLAGTQKTSMTFLDAQTATGGKAWVKTSEGWGVAELSAWPAG